MKQPRQSFALVDCNNFYASCERLFRPDLLRSPVVVVSNNDGCIVARSKEVKDLGIKMGTPVFQVEGLIKEHGIQLFSSNYTLYADISSRVMDLLRRFAPRFEVYSIDEAFLDFNGLHEDPVELGMQIRQSVLRDTGIPVCIGIAPTKTLAKLANHAAKKWRRTNGVVDLSDVQRRKRLMALVPVNEVWGIGSRLSKKLQRMGIESALDLCRQSPGRIQQQFSVVQARTVMELQGISCLALEDVVPAKQQIICSRSFRPSLTSLSDLSEALSGFCCRAAEKLRGQGCVASMLTVSLRTNPNQSNEPQYQASKSVALAFSSQDSRVIVSQAKKVLRRIYRSGFRYQKCGVLLSEIRPGSSDLQGDLFTPPSNGEEGSRLMATVDRINQRFPGQLFLAATGIEKKWRYLPRHLSPRFTTCWDELARVKCS